MTHGTAVVDLRPVRFGLLLGLVGILFGWALGLVFGADEKGLRQRYVEVAESHRVLYVQRAGSEEAATAAIKKMDESVWNYFRRAHMHGGGIGSIAVALSLVLALLSVGPLPKTVASVLLGVGSVGYPVFWMWAGMRAPALASTTAAKESLGWLAIPSAGALFVGGVITLGLVAYDLFVPRSGPRR